MPTYYVKAKRPLTRPPSRSKLKTKRQVKMFLFHRIAPIFLMGIGLVLLGSVVVPIASSRWSMTSDFQAGAVEGRGVLNPIVVRSRENLLPTLPPTPVIVSQSLDYTDLSNWFPDSALPIVEPKEERSYFISIPSIGIEDAKVVYGGKSLDQSLIQYPGTSTPGDYGAPVIFGHSTLRQLYNPSVTNPRRYISIFSTIMTLKTGDEIIVKDDGITYRYVVSTKTEVQPTDRFILEQQRNSRQLKLVTCVPEGTYLRRGVITAVLKEIQE